MARIKKFSISDDDPVQRSGSREISGDTPDARLHSWSELAASHVRGAGGFGYVIRHIEGPKGSLATRERHTLPQWLAWMAYLDSKGVPHAFLDSLGVATMPGEWPWLFDVTELENRAHWAAQADGVLAEHDRKVSRRNAPRASVQSVYRAAGYRPRMPYAEPEEAPQPPLEERLAKYAAEPVSLSPEAAAPFRATAPKGNEHDD